jgi:hypothetical protein
MLRSVLANNAAVPKGFVDEELVTATLIFENVRSQDDRGNTPFFDIFRYWMEDNS